MMERQGLWPVTIPPPDGERPLAASSGHGTVVTYQFDDFALDTGTRRLMWNDEEVHISPKAYDLLTLLIENRAQAMAKADLHEKIWPSIFVTETNLAGLVAELRRALQDSAEEPRYIRTVHRFG